MIGTRTGADGSGGTMTLHTPVRDRDCPLLDNFWGPGWAWRLFSLVWSGFGSGVWFLVLVLVLAVSDS